MTRNTNEASAADELATSAAVQRFVMTFVDPSRRERMVTMLLHKDRNKRSEAIQHVYKWVDPTRQTELAGSAGMPDQLKKRFHELSGILIDEASARHVTIGEAASLATTGFGAIFIADGHDIAVLFPEVGPPTLCSSK